MERVVDRIRSKPGLRSAAGLPGDEGVVARPVDPVPEPEDQLDH
jgi:hypothetical protein